MDLTIIREFDETLKQQWDDLVSRSSANYPFMRFGYQKSWWQTKGGGEWDQADLYIVLAHQDGELVGLAPFFTAMNKDQQKSLMLVGSHEVSDYLDVIAAPENLEAFIKALIPFLKTNIPDADVMELYNLQEESPSIKAFQHVLPEASVDVLQPTPYIPLPGDWEEYLAGIDKKQRHEIRRKIRRAESYEQPTRWYIVQDDSQLEAEADAFLELMAEGAEKAAFLSPAMRPFMRQVIFDAFQEGILFLAFLEVGGQKAAAKLYFDYDNKLWGYNSGYRRDYLELSPGWVLQGYALQWANEQKRREFDFMRGNEQYKYRFGAVDRHVMKLTARL